MAKVPKQALRWIGVDSPSELMKCKISTDTSGRLNAVLVSKADAKWARKKHSNLKGYVVQKGVSYEYPERGERKRGSRKVWVYGRSLKKCGRR